MDAITDICAEACRIAYDDTITGFAVNDLKYIIHRANGLDIIAFRGTDAAENVIRDLAILPELSPCRHLAHGGFVGAFKDLLGSGIMSQVTPSTIFTGHSLGGAIAVLFAEMTGNHVITFGCPKVYTKWGTSPILNHVRIVIDGDPIPMIPLCFRHDCDPVILCTNDDDVEITDHFIDTYIDCLGNRKDCSYAN